MTGVSYPPLDTAVLLCLKDVVDLDVMQDVVELGLVVSSTRRDTTIDVSLKENSEPSVVQGVLAALQTAFPDVTVFNVVRTWKPPSRSSFGPSGVAV